MHLRINAQKKQTDRASLSIVRTKHEENWLDELLAFRDNLEKLDDLTEILTISAHYIVFNSGKTPARVTSATVNFVCEDPATLPDKPDYNIPNVSERQTEFLLPPSREFRGTVGAALGAPTIRELFGGDRALIIYGFMNYTDVLNRQHETRYCFICKFPRFWPAPMVFNPSGKPNYILYT